MQSLYRWRQYERFKFQSSFRNLLKHAKRPCLFLKRSPWGLNRVLGKIGGTRHPWCPLCQLSSQTNYRLGTCTCCESLWGLGQSYSRTCLNPCGQLADDLKMVNYLQWIFDAFICLRITKCNKCFTQVNEISYLLKNPTSVDQWFDFCFAFLVSQFRPKN